MSVFPARYLYTLLNKIRRKKPDAPAEEKWTADFARPEKSPFLIKSDYSYNAYLLNGSLALSLKKENCIAWVDTPNLEFQDQIIEAGIRLDSLGGYCAAGIMFRIAYEETYYLALVSSKGYFRLDAVKDNSPRTLIAWTEVPDFDGINIKLNILTYGTFINIIINGKWVCETSDDTIPGGGLGFALASYPESGGQEAPESEESEGKAVCKAYLDSFSIDTRVKTIESFYNKWTDDSNINADARLRLAETFAVMGNAALSLEQISKAWKKRDAVFSVVSADYTDIKTRKELLLAARMAYRLEQYQDANDYIDAIFNFETESGENKEALVEKVRILNQLGSHDELKKFVLKNKKKINMDTEMYVLLAGSHWKLKEYEKAAAAWNEAFKLESGKDAASGTASGVKAENNAGIYATNAANALELAEKNDEALELYLTAGKIFLRQNNQNELAALVPKLVLLGEKNMEARVLTGKWAFSIEDYERCEKEFNAAEKIRRAVKPRPEADPAMYYLWGLVYHVNGKTNNAISMLKKAASLAPDFELFRVKLKELTAAAAIEKPVVKTSAKPVEKPAVKTSDKAGKKPAGKTSSKAIKKTGAKAVKKNTGRAGGETGKKPAGKTVKKPVRKTGKNPCK